MARSWISLKRQAGVVGNDTDAKTVDAAAKKGFDVRKGDIFSFPEQSEVYDVITLSHVIEHCTIPALLSMKPTDCSNPVAISGWKLPTLIVMDTISLVPAGVD